MISLALRRRAFFSSRPAIYRSMASSRSSPGKSNAVDASPTPQAEVTSQQSKGAPLPLPEPGKDDGTVQLDVGGEGVKLDHLGPLVVNQDGTMSRISNWAEMSEIERQNTLRILGKRNKLRLANLRGDSSGSPASDT